MIYSSNVIAAGLWVLQIIMITTKINTPYLRPKNGTFEERENYFYYRMKIMPILVREKAFLLESGKTTPFSAILSGKKDRLFKKSEKIILGSSWEPCQTPSSPHQMSSNIILKPLRWRIPRILLNACWFFIFFLNPTGDYPLHDTTRKITDSWTHWWYLRSSRVSHSYFLLLNAFPVILVNYGNKAGWFEQKFQNYLTVHTPWLSSYSRS